jgi:hypothetical protein
VAVTARPADLRSALSVVPLLDPTARPPIIRTLHWSHIGQHQPVLTMRSSEIFVALHQTYHRNQPARPQDIGNNSDEEDTQDSWEQPGDRGPAVSESTHTRDRQSEEEQGWNIVTRRYRYTNRSMLPEEMSFRKESNGLSQAHKRKLYFSNN